MHKSGSDGKFTSSIGFVLAAVGSAVGMANIWLFPYRVGQYGGGAFLIPYFLFVALFSYVGLSGEFALGRLTGTGAMGSLDYVLRQRGRRGGRVLGAIPLLGDARLLHPVPHHRRPGGLPARRHGGLPLPAPARLELSAQPGDLGDGHGTGLLLPVHQRRGHAHLRQLYEKGREHPPPRGHDRRTGHPGRPAFGIDPTSGPQLMFVTLPQIFQQMPGGRIFALLFFVSVFFAGITSLMNMLEACGEALTSTFRLSRTVSTLLVGAAAFLPGLFLESLAGMGSWMDLITIYVSPFGALLVAVCIYFVLGMKGIRAELALGRARAPGRLFGITARFYVFLTVAVWILGIAYGGIG